MRDARLGTVKGVGAAALFVAVGSAAAGCSWTRNNPADWDLREPVDGNVLELVVYIGSSSCHSFNGVEVDEHDDAVSITARVRSSNDSDCTADDATHEVTVRLDEPLGERALEGCRPRNPIAPRFEDPGPNCGA
jgi:hypothetical protein